MFVCFDILLLRAGWELPPLRLSPPHLPQAPQQPGKVQQDDVHFLIVLDSIQIS